MADYIDGPIHNIEIKVKNGQCKKHCKKLMPEVIDNSLSNDVKEYVRGGDTVNQIERDKINKESRKTAQTPVARLKRKISKEVRKNLGMRIS